MDMDGPPKSQRSPRGMLQRLEKTDAELQRIFSDVRNRSAWDDTFVDALCEPAETFTFGGVFAHIVTFNAHRRLMALDALRQLGVQTEGHPVGRRPQRNVLPEHLLGRHRRVVEDVQVVVRGVGHPDFLFIR